MVIDWGIATALGEKMEGGTEPYEAPEKFKQDESDVYSHGELSRMFFSEAFFE